MSECFLNIMMKSQKVLNVLSSSFPYIKEHKICFCQQPVVVLNFQWAYTVPTHLVVPALISSENVSSVKHPGLSAKEK